MKLFYNARSWIGYDNVHELGPLLDVKTTRLPLEGSEVN
jgi:hypothetical protein